MENEKHVALYSKSGSSDKEYHIHLIPKGQKYVVSIEYGRRGSSLTSSSKTPVPVDLDKALSIFEAQLHAKKLKGYTEGAGQTPYVGSDKEDKITGVLPQLLNNIEEEDLDEYFDDPEFCMQEKKDGRRILLRSTTEGLEAINRKGLRVGFPKIIETSLSSSLFSQDYILDGELIGEIFYAFDLLKWDGIDICNLGYGDRYKMLLQKLVDIDTEGSPIQLVETVFTTSSKRAVFKNLKEKGAEGVVFKLLIAPYKAGRPNSGGDQLKFKFTNNCTCQVSAYDKKGKRSVYIQMLDGKKLVDVGKVTILPNFEVPKIGTLVEVKYLYRHVHGALYQPVYLEVREDLDVPDQVNTLKIKEGLNDEEEG